MASSSPSSVKKAVKTVFPLEAAVDAADAVAMATVWAKNKREWYKKIGSLIRMLARERPVEFSGFGIAMVYLLYHGYIRWWTIPFGFVLFIMLFICFAVLRARKWVRRDLQPATNIKNTPYYQDPVLIAEASALPVSKLYLPIIAQPLEGFCGQSTLLNVINSVTHRTHLPRLPQAARPIDMSEMKAICDSLHDFDPALNIRSVQALSDLTLDQFHDHMRQLNNVKVRYLCNFLRSPLFFNDPNRKESVFILKRLFGGHWSPLGGYLEDKQLVFVLDVNHTYGNYLVGVDRLYDAVNTFDLSKGFPRGLIRIEFE